jgi:hypothetical protein
MSLHFDNTDRNPITRVKTPHIGTVIDDVDAGITIGKEFIYRIITQLPANCPQSKTIWVSYIHTRLGAHRIHTVQVLNI